MLDTNLDSDSSQQTEGGPDAHSACMALVTLSPSRHCSQAPGQMLSQPDARFVTQLIATAEQVPQTRILRRATPAYAEAAYRSVTDFDCGTPHGLLTRQES